MKIKEMIGKTFSRVDRDERNEELVFYTAEGEFFRFYHEQDCCESVCIQDVVGDLADLTGSPMLLADEESNSPSCGDDYGTKTWTFYKFATVKGFVTVSWYGSSNGYYSESVDMQHDFGAANV